MAALTDLQLDHLSRRLAAAGVTDVRRLHGGASSLTFAGVTGGQRVVVKVAPPGLQPILHRDVLRQSRIIGALAPSGVPVPEVLWEDPGDPPEVPPLFVMSFVDGTSLEPLFDMEDKAGAVERDDDHRGGSPSQRRARHGPAAPHRAGDRRPWR